MANVSLNEINKLSKLRFLESGRYLNIGFLFVGFVRVSAIATHNQALVDIKTAQLEKPRYVVFVLQIDRKNVMSEDVSRFDNCKLTNVKLYLN